MTVSSMHVPACVEMQAHVKHPGTCVDRIGVCVEHAISISLFFETMIE